MSELVEKEHWQREVRIFRNQPWEKRSTEKHSFLSNMELSSIRLFICNPYKSILDKPDRECGEQDGTINTQFSKHPAITDYRVVRSVRWRCNISWCNGPSVPRSVGEKKKAVDLLS